MNIPACSGACQQGRAACKTPQACELPEDDSDAMTDLGRAIFIVAVALLFSGLLLAALLP